MSTKYLFLDIGADMPKDISGGLSGQEGMRDARSSAERVFG